MASKSPADLTAADLGKHVELVEPNPPGSPLAVAKFSGTYLGVALDEEDGVPYHYFLGGEINGTAQGSHGTPAAPDTPLTTTKTPTALITDAEQWGAEFAITHTTRAYVAIVVGDEVLDYDLAVGSDPQQIGETGVWALHGDYEGASIAVEGRDRDEAADKILAAFQNEVTIDDLCEAADQNATLDLLAGPRTILIHLNVEVAATDPRNRDEIGDLILGALEVGLEGAPGDLASGAGGLKRTDETDGAPRTITVVCPLVDEV